MPERDEGVCTLRGRDVQRILREEFGRVRCLSAVYNLLHDIGYVRYDFRLPDLQRFDHRRYGPARPPSNLAIGVMGGEFDFVYTSEKHAWFLTKL